MEGGEIDHSGNSDGGWKHLQLDDSSNQDDVVAIVNTGALMARWTNDNWNATAHRVVVDEESSKDHRYSIACFVDPDSTSIIDVHPRFLIKSTKKYEPISSLDYLLMKLREVQQMK